jgi:hypothetical protein
VDSTPNSNLLMTNLSHQDNGIPKNKFDMNQDKENKLKTNQIKNMTQKSMLSGKILKF